MNEAKKFQHRLIRRDLQIAGVPKEEVNRLANDYVGEMDNLGNERDRDYLTGSFNRGYLFRTLGYLTETQVSSGIPVTIVMLDGDNFKSVNDKEPDKHAAGDRVLKEMVKICFKEFETEEAEEAFIARYGEGDDWVIVLPKYDAGKTTTFIAKLSIIITDNLARAADLKMMKTMTFSFGIYQVKNGDTPEIALKMADKALYFGRENGRNTIALCEPDGNLKTIK